MASRVSISRDEPITERLLQYSLNPQKVRIVLSKLLRWAKRKPDIRMQTSLMTSEESRYADILIARGVQRKHLAKETEILQTEAARLGRTDGEIEISKSILHKGIIINGIHAFIQKSFKLLVSGLECQRIITIEAILQPCL